MALTRIKLRNILSYGPSAQELDLEPLNVLIGPNASGKSNLIEVLGLLKHHRTGFWRALSESGGADEWLWQEPAGSAEGVGIAEIELTTSLPQVDPLLCYRLSFGSRGIETEELEAQGSEATRPGTPLLTRSSNDATLFLPGNGVLGGPRKERAIGIGRRELVASHFRDPFSFPELATLSDALGDISLHRDWAFGHGNAVRRPQKPDHSSAFLDEAVDNLGLVLNRLAEDMDAKRQLLDALSRLYEGVTDYRVRIEYGQVRVFLMEGHRQVPATRLSDGALRYLCLLAILCHRDPPWLVCVEEPELGLHPDILPGIADLLVEASERCQLIVTTHSEVLVDALTDTPESVVVCERFDGQTALKRLEQDELGHWLENYRLGELWSRGHIGGNRW